MGADAALGVRQPAQGLAADAPPGRRGLGVQPLVRDCYLDAGVPPERVHVVPLGVDPEVFRPGLEPLPLAAGPGNSGSCSSAGRSTARGSTCCWRPSPGPSGPATAWGW